MRSSYAVRAGPMMLWGARAQAWAGALALAPVDKEIDSEKDREDEQDAHPKIEAHESL